VRKFRLQVSAVAGFLAVTGVPAVAIVASVPADHGGVLRIVQRDILDYRALRQ
jgi:hypothetical protein